MNRTVTFKRLAILPVLLAATAMSGCMTVPATPAIAPPTVITPKPVDVYIGPPQRIIGAPVLDQPIHGGGWQNQSGGQSIPVTIVSPPVGLGRPETPSIPIVQPRAPVPGGGPVLISYPG